jgi:hypothetical protein
LLLPAETLRQDRYSKFRHMGAFVESGGRDQAAE